MWEPRGFVWPVATTNHHGGDPAFGEPLLATFAYTADDPYAVTMTLKVGALRVPWSFARDLLADGLNHPAGDGDVAIAPDTEVAGYMWITLASPTGTARLRFARAHLERVLELSERIVPLGAESEHVDWDREFDLLSRGGGR